MSKPPNKSKTNPGLGEDSGIPRLDSTEMKRVRDQFQLERAPTIRPPTRRPSVRREEDETPDLTPRSETPLAGERPPKSGRSWKPEAPTGTRRRRTSRPPVSVDDVGAAAVKIARTRRESAPKLVATRSIISRAPIDTRAAFILSLIDGRNSTAAIVDMSGMPEAEVKGILERLARLGLITLP